MADTGINLKKNKRGKGVSALPDVKHSPTLFLCDLENSTAAAGHASQRIVRDDHRQPGLFRQQFIDVAQQSTPAREHDAAICDIAAEVRRRLFERPPYRPHDALQWFVQGLPNLVRIQ